MFLKYSLLKVLSEINSQCSQCMFLPFTLGCLVFIKRIHCFLLLCFICKVKQIHTCFLWCLKLIFKWITPRRKVLTEINMIFCQKNTDLPSCLCMSDIIVNILLERLTCQHIFKVITNIIFYNISVSTFFLTNQIHARFSQG